MKKNQKSKNGNKPSFALDGASRELLKESGWRKYGTCKDVIDRADGLQLVVFAHYHRSKDGYNGLHPEFEKFAQHWLLANGEMYETEVIVFLKQKFGPVKGKQRIAPGASYWD